MGCFWSSAEGRTRVKPDLVMLQPPAPPAPRPPSARHVTAGELQENAEGLRWKSYRQVPNRPWSEVCWHGYGKKKYSVEHRLNVRGNCLRATYASQTLHEAPSIT